jgi:hypothetical protein
VRSCCEKRLLTGMMARADVRRRRSESDSGDGDRVRGIRSECSPPHILADERDRAIRYVVAVVVARYPRGRGGIPVPAAGCRGLPLVTPHPAQQPGVLPYGQRKHDGNDGCSKHVKLAPTKARTTPIQTLQDGLKTAAFPDRRFTAEPGLRDFPTRCRKSRGAFITGRQVDCLVRSYFERCNFAVPNCTRTS